MKRQLISLTLLLVAACAMAAPRLRDLDIHVTLSQDGSALIRETRQMDIDGSGTEMYIVLGNLGDSELSVMSVSDESGASFTFEGAWDVNRSRSEKAGRCGIVTTRNGYELCWGLGQQGARTYVCTYRLSGLVRSFTDADGFNFMFVAEGLSPRPEQRICAAADSALLPGQTIRSDNRLLKELFDCSGKFPWGVGVNVVAAPVDDLVF